MAGIAIEHGSAICQLADGEATASMVVLLRVQFEAVVRAIWLLHGATDEFIERVAGALRAGTVKDFNNVPDMDSMLTSITGKAPADVVSMLTELKRGAWKPMNSFVHSNVLPLQHAVRERPTGFVSNTLTNANGLSFLAAMAIGVCSGDHRVTLTLRDVQVAYRDCLPPLRPAT